MADVLPWIEEARKLLGTKEIPGSSSNPKIIEWAKALGGWVAQFYRNDDIAWCGLFVSHCVQVAGLKPPPDMLLAVGWNKWGLKQDKPTYGSIVVFRWSNGRHHVGFAVAQDKSKNIIHALGGNQSNNVTIAKYPMSACMGFRFPICDIKPTIELPYA